MDPIVIVNKTFDEMGEMALNAIVMENTNMLLITPDTSGLDKDIIETFNKVFVYDINEERFNEFDASILLAALYFSVRDNKMMLVVGKSNALSEWVSMLFKEVIGSEFDFNESLKIPIDLNNTFYTAAMNINIREKIQPLL